eukprot:TRINITY_DN4489_c0_g1_i1.p1 TRINITY_DN4489_c0_g1~~TRINITY_DN4489_c0_g1_i1.p1  ORF type:complete len:198 (-),score=28.99 TRINITY_DN4489_c0_g1_i1:6-599(-)
MMLVAFLLLALQVNARELQGKEVVVTTKSRQPTRYYKPTYSSKTHYSTPIVNVAPSKQKKVIPSHSKKFANPVKSSFVIVEEAEKKSPILVVSSKPSPSPAPEASNQTSPPQSPSPMPTPQIEPSPSPVPSPITPDESTPSSPTVIPSPSPSPIPSPSPACFDNPPDAEYTCAEQASFGRCNAAFLQGFCDKTCGRC